MACEVWLLSARLEPAALTTQRQRPNNQHGTVCAGVALGAKAAGLLLPTTLWPEVLSLSPGH